VTRAQTYVLAIMQCSLWLAQSVKCAEASRNTKAPQWSRQYAGAEARRFVAEADTVSQRFFGRNASNLV
jgi:hypothetical protein